jgi:uncharacterized protein (DUF1330 family)
MTFNRATAAALAAGLVLGAAAVHGLHAQAAAPTYAVIDIASITDPAAYATLVPKGGPATAAFGGKFLARTDTIAGSDGTPPQRFILIAFDSLARAKAWRASPGMQEVWATQEKASKSRIFFVEGLPQ